MKNHYHQPLWLRLLGLVGNLFCALVIMLVGELLGMAVLYLALEHVTVSPFTKALQMYLPFIGMWLVLFFVIWVVKRNHFIWDAIKYDGRGNSWRGLGIGLLVGLAMNALCVLQAFLRGDVAFAWRGEGVVATVIVFLTVLIQSGAEELVCRGFIYQKTRQNFRSPAAWILINPCFFTAMHLGNNGVTVLAMLNIFAIGLCMSLIVYYFNSLWAAIGIHTAWNFCQNIIFGLPNSGETLPFSLLKLTHATGHRTLAYDPGFGIEGTVMSLVMIAIVAIATVCLKKGQLALAED